MCTKKEVRNSAYEGKTLGVGRHLEGNTIPQAKAFGKNPKARGLQGLQRSPGFGRHLSGNNKMIVRGQRVKQKCELARGKQGHIKVICWMADALTPIWNLLQVGIGRELRRRGEQRPIRVLTGEGQTSGHHDTGAVCDACCTFAPHVTRCCLKWGKY